ncbi:hypothetical protein C8R44DRAFT_747717 [Mycena epipterygia]|nr:hypothetical protein C8R44DRAFT_747717 [Mycena epipterygia]
MVNSRLDVYDALSHFPEADADFVFTFDSYLVCFEDPGGYYTTVAHRYHKPYLSALNVIRISSFSLQPESTRSGLHALPSPDRVGYRHVPVDFTSRQLNCESAKSGLGLPAQRLDAAAEEQPARVINTACAVTAFRIHSHSTAYPEVLARCRLAAASRSSPSAARAAHRLASARRGSAEFGGRASEGLPEATRSTAI